MKFHSSLHGEFLINISGRLCLQATFTSSITISAPKGPDVFSDVRIYSVIEGQQKGLVGGGGRMLEPVKYKTNHLRNIELKPYVNQHA